jgi:hypothetical protein
MQITVILLNGRHIYSTNFKVVMLIKVNNIELDVIGDINTYTTLLMSLPAKMSSQGTLTKVSKSYFIGPQVFCQAKNLGDSRYQ